MRDGCFNGILLRILYNKTTKKNKRKQLNFETADNDKNKTLQQDIIDSFKSYKSFKSWRYNRSRRNFYNRRYNGRNNNSSYKEND